MRADDPQIEYSKVVEMMRSAFLAGYMAKKSGPYTLNGYTLQKLQDAIDVEATGILEEFYEIGE